MENILENKDVKDLELINFEELGAEGALLGVHESGAAKRVKMQTPLSSWTDLPSLNGYPVGFYTIYNKVVFVVINMSNSVAYQSNHFEIAILPPGYRPLRTIYFNCAETQMWDESDNMMGSCGTTLYIDTDGRIVSRGILGSTNLTPASGWLVRYNSAFVCFPIAW